MTNRNAETLTHLYAARTALTAYRASLDTANAATQPSAKLTALYAARAHHADYLAALKRGDYVYQDGKGRINTKLGFDFEKTVADSGADKWAVWQQVEPLPPGDIAAILNMLQAQFDAFIADWRSRIIVEINAILQTNLPDLSPMPDWTGRNFLYIVAARAALETCIKASDFRACLATSPVVEFQTAWYIVQIRAVVGNDFDAALLNVDALTDLYATLTTIQTLKNTYHINPIGADGETLGMWLSSASIDLSRIATLEQAVTAAANALRDQITSWSDPDTGYLRGITTSGALAALQGAANAAAAFQLVVGADWMLPARLAPTKYTPDATKLFGYLYGWDYAKFARQVIRIDWDIYNATFSTAVDRLWKSGNWLPTSSQLLRIDWSDLSGFSNTSTTSIDPVYSLDNGRSPGDKLNDWKLWVQNSSPQQCSSQRPLCPQNSTSPCYVKSLYDDVTNPQATFWAGLLRTNGWLPYLPSSVIAGCPDARRGLAQGIVALWNEIGIYQNYEDVTRLINLLEHGNALADDEDRQTMFHVLHYLYWTTQPQGGVTREEEYVAGASSTIFEIENGTEVRTYRYLLNMLTPVGEIQGETDYAFQYANDPLGFAWGQFNQTTLLGYTDDAKNIVQAGANRTFGSTEFNRIEQADRATLVVQQQQSSGSAWIAFLTPEQNPVLDQAYDPSSPSPADLIAPFGVFMVTPSQFDTLQFLLPKAN